ncbi:hypothetical protein B0H63DRAFT_510203 [Podospora didyma]|uniref:Uncharacterized protein n=1 Tax=Podospora didyma TaxID=330526 RepID=A0AAE0TZH6_9PEZI|nr:hypothetical protein B0H63DRAFT_510203 [Podospora didyma]
MVKNRTRPEIACTTRHLQPRIAAVAAGAQRLTPTESLCSGSVSVHIGTTINQNNLAKQGSGITPGALDDETCPALSDVDTVNVANEAASPTSPSALPAPTPPRAVDADHSIKKLSSRKRVNSDDPISPSRRAKRRSGDSAPPRKEDAMVGGEEWTHLDRHASSQDEECDEQDSADDSSDDTDSEVEDSHHAIILNERFGCPLHHLNPQMYTDYVKRGRGGFRSPGRVRRHILNKHCRPPFCPKYRAIFQTQTESDRHIRDRGCALRTTPEIEGVHGDNIDRLALWRPGLGESFAYQLRSITEIVLPAAPSEKESRSKLGSQTSSDEGGSVWEHV